MPIDTHDGELWKRVHAALDRREDPFGDPAVQELLLREPDLAPEVERLCARVDAIASAEPVTPVTPARRSAARPWFVAAGLLAAALVALLAPRFRSAPTAELETAPVAAEIAATAPLAPAPTLRVLRFALAVQVDGATHSVEGRQLRTGGLLRTETLRSPSSQWTAQSLESNETTR